MLKCPDCIARKRKDKEDTAKRTNVAKILDDGPALEAKIKRARELFVALQGWHLSSWHTNHGQTFSKDCQVCLLIEQGIGL